ncbi:MAG TPA: GTP-binding protein [Moraxellaceae bacterium]|nr:GTP-binding protein [Moraxellaceae bacterium]
MYELKIVITGCVGAGKSTAISAISDIPVISTEVDASDEVAKEKKTTTVAMDYGEVTLEDGQIIKIYGTPGQKRFAYMWEILAEGALGIIILLNDKRPDPVGDMDMYLENFNEQIRQSVAVIGVTHAEDDAEGVAMSKYYDYLSERGLNHPVFSVDARDKMQMRLMLETMAAIIGSEEMLDGRVD